MIANGTQKKRAVQYRATLLLLVAIQPKTCSELPLALTGVKEMNRETALAQIRYFLAKAKKYNSNILLQLKLKSIKP